MERSRKITSMLYLFFNQRQLILVTKRDDFFAIYSIIRYTIQYSKSSFYAIRESSMNRIKKIALLATFGFLFSASSFAQIPDEYLANAESQAKYDKIVNELFVEIQSKSQIGQPISTTVFAELYQLFGDIIPHLPNKYSFNIIYQQCLTLSQTLSNGYNLNTLASFMDNCFKPFVKTVEEINKDYTIKPSGSINPTT